ncbi:hypothetical protein [Rhizobium leguminosarum]|uniref:SLOG cluster 4 domain-containing protein n=1 Tax=Rhizobium leguminosarum TaxID=384 RepID=UPI0015D97486|nr:hypothetical protein [Rhizobium leguminosarum]NZD53600.1 hypothetical protein [Rhizobium leguminosarum]
MARKAIVGVIGGNGVPTATEQAAERAGRAIARAGVILLTGGQPIRVSEVKCAAMRGAMATESDEGGTARLIGVCPSGELVVPLKTASKWLMDTGLSSAERNPINGMTPDVLLMFEGGPGTLSELVFAFAAKKPVIYVGSITALDEAMQDENAVRAKVGKATTKFRGAFEPSVLNRAHDAANNLQVLYDHFCNQMSEPPLAEGWPKDARNDAWANDLVSSALKAVPARILELRADFPGIPQGLSKKTFDDWLFAMP